MSDWDFSQISMVVEHTNIHTYEKRYLTDWGEVDGRLYDLIKELAKSNQTEKLKQCIELHQCGYHEIPKHYISPELTELYQFLYEL